MNEELLKVGLAQITPVWLNKRQTLNKVIDYVKQAGDQDCDLVVFGESILPGYPFWLSITNGSAFNNQIQKEIHAHYIKNAIQIEAGDLEPLQKEAANKKIAVYLGTIERAKNRGGHSLYCSLVYIDKEGVIQSVHRKLQPTFEERLAWSPGDGHGLRVHALKQFTLGGLNCWENWMPLSRVALYGMGENVHIAVWPGAKRNTENITRYIAEESRSYVISVSGLLSKEVIPTDLPHYETIIENAPPILANGGSCIAGPDGKWIVEPIVNKEGLFVETLDFNRILQERQNFDVVGHYSRPDVTQLLVNRERQSILKFK